MSGATRFHSGTSNMECGVIRYRNCVIPEEKAASGIPHLHDFVSQESRACENRKIMRLSQRRRPTFRLTVGRPSIEFSCQSVAGLSEL